MLGAIGAAPTSTNGGDHDSSCPHYGIGGEMAARNKYIPLSIRQATITLEDLAYIYGIPIDGPIVTGRTFPNSIIQEVCLDLLGRTPQPGPDVNGINIRFSWLEENFRPSIRKKKKKHSREGDLQHSGLSIFSGVGTKYLKLFGRKRTGLSS